MACIYMLQTLVMYHKARHIDMQVYHLRELCKDGALVLEKVASADQVADSLTKSTLKPAFEKHHDAMMGFKGSRNVSSRLGVVAIDEMEGIELEARHETDFEDVGLMALYFGTDSDETELDHNGKVSKLKVRGCKRGDEEYGYFDPLMIRLIVVCVLLILKAMYCRAREYDDDLDFRLGIHYAQCM
eukprot:1977964-Rhodomonas_salina.1